MQSKFKVGDRVRFTLESHTYGLVVDKIFDKFIGPETMEPVDEYGWYYYVNLDEGLQRVGICEKFLELAM
jgi:hypothetical protein